MRKARYQTLGIVLALILGGLAVVLSGLGVTVGPEAVGWPRFAPPLVFALMSKSPEVMPAPLVFVLGLAQDLLLGNVIGAGLLALLIAFFAGQKRARQLVHAPFVWCWLAFGPFVVLVFAVEWALTTIAHLQAAPVESAVIQGAATFLLFPLMVLVIQPVVALSRPRPARR